MSFLNKMLIYSYHRSIPYCKQDSVIRMDQYISKYETGIQGGSKKSKLLYCVNSLLFFEPPCIQAADRMAIITQKKFKRLTQNIADILYHTR